MAHNSSFTQINPGNEMPELVTTISFVGLIYDRTRRLIKGAIEFPKRVRKTGGIIRAMYKLVTVLKHEGVSGIGARLINQKQSSNYTKWVSRNDLSTEELKNTINKTIVNFKDTPLISVIMPTYNPKPEWLIESIASVQNQIYTHWELCIADDASTNPAIQQILERFARDDNRIKVVFRNQNGHISAASNSALDLATGEWVALLDHDDLLSDQALFWIVDSINKKPNATVIYSDEDKITEKGQRIFPFFKPDWSPHLALSQAYIGHFACLNSSLIREIGGFDIQLNGAQDYDLWLRAALVASEIAHIPRILYHWRMHESSTALSSDSKPYAHEAGKTAVQRYINSRYPHINTKVIDGDHLFTYKAEFELPSDTLVSIIIPTRDKIDLLQPCIDSILAISTWSAFEIIVIDNGSTDPETIEYLKRAPAQDSRIRVIQANVPFNWSHINNIGANAAKGDVLIFLNNDTEIISSNWIESLSGYALLPDVGLVGALLLFEDGSIQHTGVVVGMGGWADHVYRLQAPVHSGGGPFVSPVLTRNVLAVTGACMAIARTKFDMLGRFDEDFIVCGSDVELCLRAHNKGFYNVVCTEARLTHLESKTRSSHVPENDFAQSILKYSPYRIEKVDPFFNPNLSLNTTRPQIEMRS